MTVRPDGSDGEGRREVTSESGEERKARHVYNVEILPFQLRIGTSSAFQVQESVTGNCQFTHDHIIFLSIRDTSEHERGHC